MIREMCMWPLHCPSKEDVVQRAQTMNNRNEASFAVLKCSGVARWKSGMLESSVWVPECQEIFCSCRYKCFRKKNRAKSSAQSTGVAC